LYDLADESSALDSTLDDLTRLQTMIDESSDLRRLITSPVIARDDQGKAIAAVAERAELGDLTRRFVSLVAANRRLFALQDMIRAYRAILAHRRGEVTAEVTSAGPLSEAQGTAIAEALRASVGSKVSIEARVDPSLLGGLVVKVGSRMVDSSLRTKLQKLQFALKGAA
jgi:F-type H+-transporting ATPase subunit delta